MFKSRAWGILLWPASLLFTLGVWIRNRLYDRNRLKVSSIEEGVISVGNIAVGGTGKTPCVEWLATRLQARGLKSCVLTRGYGRSGRETEEVPKGLIRDGRRDFGDEPLLLSDRLEETPVISNCNTQRLLPMFS